MAAPDDHQDLIRKVVDFFVLVVGVVAAVAQLAGISAGVGRVLLTIVAAACLLFAAFRFYAGSLVGKNLQLKTKLEESSLQLTAQEALHEKYVNAIGRIIDRESPLFLETLTITVMIGADDDSDLIREHRSTQPTPRVSQRAIHLIVPTAEDRVTRFDDVGFRVLQASGNITPLPLLEKIRMLRVWLVFDPSLTKTSGPAEWEIEYSPKAMWAPFRRDGLDRLVWHDRLPTENGGRSSLTAIVVRFLFPPSSKAPQVEELGQLGSFEAPTTIESGQWLIVWRDEKPAGHTYTWELARAKD